MLWTIHLVWQNATINNKWAKCWIHLKNNNNKVHWRFTRQHPYIAHISFVYSFVLKMNTDVNIKANVLNIPKPELAPPWNWCQNFNSRMNFFVKLVFGRRLLAIGLLSLHSHEQSTLSNHTFRLYNTHTRICSPDALLFCVESSSKRVFLPNLSHFKRENIKCISILNLPKLISSKLSQVFSSTLSIAIASNDTNN